MEKHEFPAVVLREIAAWKRDGYELLDVDAWDLPLVTEYVMTFYRSLSTVMVQRVDVYPYDHKTVFHGPLEMNADQFRHVAQVLAEREAQEHAAV